MFQHLCGHEALSKVVLGTTKWKRTEHEIARAHQKELQDVHWRALMQKGAKVMPFVDTTASAQAFIKPLVANARKQKLTDIYLQIQKEMVDKKKIIPETEAGKELRFTLKEVLEMQQRMANMEKTLAADGDEHAQQQLQEAEEKIQLLLKQIKALRIPFSRKFRRLFGL